MPIFRTKHRYDKTMKYVGGYLPLHINCYVTLYSLAKGKTKTAIIEEAAELWMKEVVQLHPEKDLIKILGMNAVLEYERAKKEDARLMPSVFAKSLIKELEEKGLTTAIIKEIIKLFDNGTN